MKTEQQNLRVLGTSFAIRAYANESVVLTTLETGKVNIHSKGQEVILTPGEQSCLKGGNLTVAKVNTTLFTAWHKGIFIFQDQPLENILNTLARWYNIDIFYTNENLQNIHFTGELKRYDRNKEYHSKHEKLEKERRLELAFENQHWFDLLRWGKAVEVVNKQITETEGFYDKYAFTVNKIADWQLLLPIPQSVIDINPSVVTQNPNY